MTDTAIDLLQQIYASQQAPEGEKEELFNEVMEDVASFLEEFENEKQSK